MEPFMVAKQTLDALVATALYGPRDAEDGVWTMPRPGNPNDLGEMLIKANVRGVQAEKFSFSPESEPYLFPREARPLSILEAAAALQVFELQACRCPGWQNTEPFLFCARMRKHLLEALPGYVDTAGEVFALASNLDPDCGSQEIPQDAAYPDFEFNQEIPASQEEWQPVA